MTRASIEAWFSKETIPGGQAKCTRFQRFVSFSRWTFPSILDFLVVWRRIYRPEPRLRTIATPQRKLFFTSLPGCLWILTVTASIRRWHFHAFSNANFVQIVCKFPRDSPSDFSKFPSFWWWKSKLILSRECAHVQWTTYRCLRESGGFCC